MGLLQHVAQLSVARIWEACGGAPIVAAMIYAERMGANQARVLKYENSGDVTGDHSRVVGYSADVFVKADSGKTMETPFSLTEAEERVACPGAQVGGICGSGKIRV